MHMLLQPFSFACCACIYICSRLKAFSQGDGLAAGGIALVSYAVESTAMQSGRGAAL